MLGYALLDGVVLCQHGVVKVWLLPHENLLTVVVYHSSAAG